MAEVEYGSVIGSGRDRVYVTKEGDTLEALAGFFYGDPVHKARILEENPELMLESEPLPAGKQVRISEDSEKGDSVA